jgi:putative transposase
MHAHRRTAGTGHLDQGRFKSFSVQSDEHFLTVHRYVERNALRANLVGRAEDWRWGSLGVPRTKDDADRPALTP